MRGIKLEDGDCVAGVTLVDDTKTLCTITERGFGKRTAFDEFTCHNRGGKGVICHNINDRTGALAGISTVAEDDDLMMITSSGTMIRVNAGDLSQYGRSAAGVIVMRLDEGSYVVNFAKVEKQDEEESAEEQA